MARAFGWPSWALAALLLFLLAGRDLLVQPPPLPDRVAPGAFDTDRAIARLSRLLGDQRPHPVDTPANDAVRARLVAELRALGLAPRIVEKTDCTSFALRPSLSCAHVRNVVATIPGRDAAAPHLLLNAHYDSTPTGPGAADDGIGVAAMLEVAALLTAEPPQRPVTLLFNEGEEWGLNGATVFLEQDPLAGRIAALINIEARGVSGPAVMFDTSRPNGAALAAYAAATRRPVANSLTADFATLIPNYTDVMVFRDKGWTILGFAIIGNETRYHSPGDTIQSLDKRSLHHVGSEVLAATRALAAPTTAATPVAYTDLAGRTLLHLPRWAALLGVALLTAAFLQRAWRRRALAPLARLLPVALLAILAALLLSELAAQLRPGDYWRAHPRLAHLAVDLTLLAALTLALRRAKPDQLPLAAWSLVMLTGAAASLALPGASIIFLLAPSLALAGFWIGGRAELLLRLAALLVHLVMVAELLALIDLLLIDGPLYAGAPILVLALLPLLAEAHRALTRPWPVAIAMLAGAVWAVALMAPRASEARPAPFTLDHVTDRIHGRSSWAVASKQAPLPDRWPDRDRWRVETLPYNGRPRWVAPAPALPLPPPTVTRLADDALPAGRRVRLAIESRGADQWALTLPKDTGLRRAGLPGRLRVMAQGPGRATLRCAGRHCDGLILDLVLSKAGPVEAQLVTTRFGLPAAAAPLVAARPARSQPQYLPDSRVLVSGVRF